MAAAAVAATASETFRCLMKNFILSLLAVFVLLCMPVWGQHIADVVNATVIKPVAAEPLPDDQLGTQKLVENRARVLRDRLDGSGTRYFAADDATLANKTPAEIAAALAPPPVTAGTGVKRVDIVVDIRRSLSIPVKRNAPVLIGTTVVDSKTHQLETSADINLQNVRLINK